MHSGVKYTRRYLLLIVYQPSPTPLKALKVDTFIVYGVVTDKEGCPVHPGLSGRHRIGPSNEKPWLRKQPGSISRNPSYQTALFPKPNAAMIRIRCSTPDLPTLPTDDDERSGLCSEKYVSGCAPTSAQCKS